MFFHTNGDPHMSYEPFFHLRMRRFKLQCRMLAKLIDSSKSEETFTRACGECECELCTLEYFDHPQLPNGLVILCDGSFVKL